MTRVLVIRHAEALGNVNHTFQGHTDAPLTERGKKQLKKLAARCLKEFPLDVIYTSDLIRAYETGLAAAAGRDIPVIQCPGLREIDGGEWEGKSWDELPARYPEVWDNWANHPERVVMPGGESMTHLRERITRTILSLAAENDGRFIGIASHGGAIRAFLSAAYGYELADINRVGWSDNTALSELIVTDGQMQVCYSGDAAHLDGLSTMATQNWWKAGSQD